MSADKMRLLSETVSRLVSKIDDRKTEIEGLQEGIQHIKAHLDNVYADRKDFIYERIIPSLKRIAGHYKRKEISESQRDELLQDRRNALLPFNDKIQEYKETIELLEKRIHVLNEKIQETGEKIHALLTSQQTEAAELLKKTETAQYIFSYTRFNPALFQAPPPAKGNKPPVTVQEAFKQYISSHPMSQSKGS